MTGLQARYFLTCDIRELNKMITKSGIEYTNRKAIKINGKIIGWHLYNKNRGMLGATKFVGYLWIGGDTR